jgi:N-glycosylase/DNA lyase
MRLTQKSFPVHDYDLAATLSSGQAFRWRLIDGAWEGVIGAHWVRLKQRDETILAATATLFSDWSWLTNYLQLGVDLNGILSTFPDDEPMRLAKTNCRGLRLLRQEPWECLASFILSSTKQIVQIQQIVGLLCERFGEQLPVPPGHEAVYSFPTAERLAACAEVDLRNCKMGFRAPYLLETANMVANGEINLSSLYSLGVDVAREELMRLPGVGRKIADCVLLFAYGFQPAFPIDVWILKALRQLYFPKRKPSAKRLLRFSQTHFGPHSGYAQQYLFHYMRTKRVE